MKITILVEGATERVFLPSLQDFLYRHLGKKPSLSVHTCDGRIPKGDKLRRIVEHLLTKRPQAPGQELTNAWASRPASPRTTA